MKLALCVFSGLLNNASSVVGDRTCTEGFAARLLDSDRAPLGRTRRTTNGGREPSGLLALLDVRPGVMSASVTCILKNQPYSFQASGLEEQETRSG